VVSTTAAVNDRCFNNYLMDVSVIYGITADRFLFGSMSHVGRAGQKESLGLCFDVERSAAT